MKVHIVTNCSEIRHAFFATMAEGGKRRKPADLKEERLSEMGSRFQWNMSAMAGLLNYLFIFVLDYC